MAVWLVLCILASVRDLSDRTISNRFLTLMALVAASPRSFCMAAAPGVFANAWPPASHLALAAAVLVLGAVFVRVSKGGLGAGDVKLFCLWCLLLGEPALWGLALACVSGALCARVSHRRAFAFAPWICIGCWVALVYTGL